MVRFAHRKSLNSFINIVSVDEGKGTKKEAPPKCNKLNKILITQQLMHLQEGE